MARDPGTYCTVRKHQDGQHDAGCLPPADPRNPELRLLRAIFGLCSLCDREDEHEHADEEIRAAGMIPDARSTDEEVLPCLSPTWSTPSRGRSPSSRHPASRRGRLSPRPMA